MRYWFATILTFAAREAKELLRDRVRTFFAVFGPVVLMAAVSWGVSFDVNGLSFAVLDRDQSVESRRLLEQFRGSAYFTERPPLAADTDADYALESTDAKLVIDIPPNFGRDLLRGDPPEIGLFIDGAETFNASNIIAYANGAVTAYLKEFARKNGLPPLQSAAGIEPRFIYNQDFKSIFSIAPGVLMMALTLFPAMMAAVGVVREHELGSISNFYGSPAGKLQFLFGKQLPYVAASMASFVALYLMIVLWFGVSLKGSAAALVLGTLLFVCTTTAMGLLVSCFMRSQVAAIFLTAIVTSAPALSFSGFITPVTSLQGSAYVAGRILPYSWYNTITVGTFTKGLGFTELAQELVVLAGFYVLFFTLACICLKKQEA